jgi:AcrR family transcriptional regulator
VPKPNSSVTGGDAALAGRRQRSDARRNRAAIVSTAVELSREGQLVMERLAAAAGVSRSTLYRHFPNRTSLERALDAAALVATTRAVEGAVADGKPPLAVLRRLVAGLAEVGAKYRAHTRQVLAEADAIQALEGAIVPVLDSLREAAEVAPSLPPEWLSTAAQHLVSACLEASSSSDDPEATTEGLFRSLTEPLDRGLVVLDPEGALLAINPQAARVLDPGDQVEVGQPLIAPRAEALYEDGSPCPAEAYPLRVAVYTGEPQTAAVRGHRDVRGAVVWTAVEAQLLSHPTTGSVYGVVGVLADITPEREWELERLAPAGKLRPVAPVPMDIATVLDEIPPHLFPEQFVAEARRINGAPVALYVLDIDGSNLLRLAGAEEFPPRLDAPLALGPELAEDGIPDLRASLEDKLPGVGVVPMWLRGRAIGVLLTLNVAERPLAELARQGAAAMELAGGYTDVFDAARRRKETNPAAELQQSLTPPRLARMGTGELAGSVLPSYEVGGDWFDYVENRDGAWIAVADAVGKGPTAGALGGIALATLRAARRSDQSLEEAAQAMHEAICDISRPEFFVTALVARWHAVYSSFSWVNCGHPPPLVVRTDLSIEQLTTESSLPLGLLDRERRFTRHQRRLQDDERLILHSDGITARRTPAGLFGLDGIERAVRAASPQSAAGIARAIQEAVVRASEDELQDDAVVVVLAPTTARVDRPRDVRGEEPAL